MISIFGIITAKRLLYRGHGQGDTRARPASAMMANYTMPLMRTWYNNRLMARAMTPYCFLDNLKMITDGMDAAAFKAAL